MNRLRKIGSVLAFLGGVAYPFIVYFFYGDCHLWALLALALALLGARLWGLRAKFGARNVMMLLVGVSTLLGLVYLRNEGLAIKAYPVLVSLFFASVFAFSLLCPPTVVELFARIKEPELSPEGVCYARRVTLVWFVFLLVNAGISVASALWGTLQQWTLWNGLLSYLCMGVLFAGEFLIRKNLSRKKVCL